MTQQRDPDLFERIRFRGRPVAHRDATVVAGKARFTFLTARLVRLEWSETGQFEDRGTYAFPTRYTASPPSISVRAEGDDLLLDSGALLLRCSRDARFSADSLSISFLLNGERVTWTPGMPDPQNLRGTRRTLDGAPGDAALETGLLSRAGWALFDDTRSVLFNLDDGWVAPRPDREVLDWYFFGYGHDYKGALVEYTQFGGQIPLIPRFVLGAWWSRYWAYSAQDLMDLVHDFERHDLPLDVLVIDMDWHTPHAWTGYTWNRDLFPDPPGFLRWVHDKGLRATLNLHPAMGVQHFEEIYPRFARAMGVDPESKEAVPFHITDKRFVERYFTLLHHPMEDQGVDFWWIDWQQGEGSEMRGLDPLSWLNHLHFSDSTRCGGRPMLYSRWGGLGNHRYHIGFSGDTIVLWTALQFQPYFTATASNVAYGWWSHDIGGHMGGATEPELYARWVQFGALSPCLRLHATKDPRAERRPWKYPDQVCHAASAAFHLRYQLVPYFYTMARIASDTSIPLCRPMYYEHPEEDAAYAARYQFYLGDQLIAAPIVHPADVDTGMASADVWVPDGTWIDYQTRETFVGPRWVRLVGDLDRVPILLKAGAIIPLAASFRDPSGGRMSSGSTDAIPHDELVFQVFPGSASTFRLYEDDGISMDYQRGQYQWTTVKAHTEGDNAWMVEIAPVEGECDALPAARRYVLHLEGCRQPKAVMVDGEGTKEWTYNPETLTTTVLVPARDKHQPVQVTAWAPDGLVALGEAHSAEVARGDVWRLLGAGWGGEAGDVEAVLRSRLPGRADAVARLGGPFVRFIEHVTPEEAARQLGRVIVGGPARADDPYDLRITFRLTCGAETQTRVIERPHSTASQIVDAPFAFDGQVRTMRWDAVVEIAWRGEQLTFVHHSQPLFPTIHTWRTLVYDRTSPLSLTEVVDDRGIVDTSLAWELDIQDTDRLANLTQPHVIRFWRAYRERLQTGEALSGYVTTTIVCPSDRDAVLAFAAGGEATIYLNGQETASEPAGEGLAAYAFTREARVTPPVHLRQGENTLLIDTAPPREGRPLWFFGGAFVTPGEMPEAMTDLLFR